MEFFKIPRDAKGVPRLNKDQKDFVYLHYVQYADPEDMVTILDWLYQTKKSAVENQNIGLL